MFFFSSSGPTAGEIHTYCYICALLTTSKIFYVLYCYCIVFLSVSALVKLDWCASYEKPNCQIVSVGHREQEKWEDIYMKNHIPAVTYSLFFFFFSFFRLSRIVRTKQVKCGIIAHTVSYAVYAAAHINHRDRTNWPLQKCNKKQLFNSMQCIFFCFVLSTVFLQFDCCVPSTHLLYYYLWNII